MSESKNSLARPGSTPDAPPPQPEHIGRYRIESVIGTGGFGLVYLARDEQLRRFVAVKVPHPHRVLTPNDARAYLEEARAVASLDHANIVPVFDVGSTGSCPCFIVSKYIEGRSLAQRLREGRLTVLEAAGLVAAIGDALHYAHGKGVVHRDIKPGNVRIDASGKPFLLDFGLALREGTVGPSSAFVGTPAYMSPEQARGEGHRVDGRSDIFSLGVVFYQLLVGRLPFEAGTQEELLQQITGAEARPPRRVDARVPKELERICLKALSKRSTDRYATAGDLADDLRHWASTPLGAADRPVDPGPNQPLARGADKAVFISYASADADAANQLCHLLEGVGVGCWIAPRDVPPGGDYREAILRAIEATPLMVLLLSAGANDSVHVRSEVERAISKGKRVVPVRLEEVLPGPALELHLSPLQWVDAWRLGLDSVASQLFSVVRGAVASPQSEPHVGPASGNQRLRIVPKGLRAFDARDADFFLELLPGPRDRDGLPDLIRAAKALLEERDAEKTFSVGLICGPSGCGKSSLMRAGLLPRLSKDVIVVYVESTAEETEARVLSGIRKRCPAAPSDLGLKETLAALRRGQGLAAGKKLLIVLDQFEQWLHARRQERDTELVRALRQCDGGRVQGVVMVRDDFWMAVIRFMRELEIRLLDGQNSTAIDLIPGRHAMKILAAFGRAYGVLPEDPNATTRDQNLFLEQAVAGLEDEGKVVCVRLALFAQMMKGKAWTPATLREVGGAEGVGVAFLDDTFGPSGALEHRYHQRAARAVLSALLPNSGSDIKGHMRSSRELRDVSGYGTRPGDFDDLIRILDRELRLITPTDPEGRDADEEPAAGPRPEQGYYQLTHDYLVPSLRQWLTRKRKETRRGRAELLLADRAVVWNARRESRQLPSLWQWLQLRFLTRKSAWTPPQRRMMRKAARHHSVRGAVLCACLVLLGLIGWDRYGRMQAENLRDRLLESATPEAPGIVKKMAPYRRWIDPLLRESRARAEESNDPRRQLHASLALLPVDRGQADYLYRRLLEGEPQEVVVIRQVLLDHQPAVAERLWALVEAPHAEEGQRLRAACALAASTAADARWGRAGADVATILVGQDPFAVSDWTNALRPVGHWLVPSLAGFLWDEHRTPASKGLIAKVYGAFAADAPEAYARLESQLAETVEPDATPEARVALATRQASVAVALVHMGRCEKGLAPLRHGPDPTLQGLLIERLGPWGCDPKEMVALLGSKQPAQIDRGLLLSLGEFGPDRLPESLRSKLIPTLLLQYRDEPDPGTHGAIEWLLRRWGASEELLVIDRGLATKDPIAERRWFVNRQGHTLTIVPSPGEVWMGERTWRRRVRVDRTFAIASKEVTVKQFLEFRKHEYRRESAPSEDCPVNNVAWFDAVAYCNWLSEREGIPKEQWCYLPNSQGSYADGMSLAPNYLRLGGYRLPEDAEWQHACRAGAVSEYSFGRSVEVLGKYAWLHGNSSEKSHPVGQLKPNDFGLFDMLGNNWEWCQDPEDFFPALGTASWGGHTGHSTNYLRIEGFVPRVLRGGAYSSQASETRCDSRNFNWPTFPYKNYGFRVARTILP